MEPVEQVAPDTWRYELTNTSRENVGDLVRHEDVADTHYIDRTTFEGREDAPPGVRRPGPLGARWPAFAYRLVDIGPVVLLVLAAVTALFAVKPQETQATAMRAVGFLTRGIPTMSPRGLAVFRPAYGLALALYVHSQPFPDPRVPPDPYRTDAPLVDVAPIHWLVDRPAIVRAGQWAANSGRHPVRRGNPAKAAVRGRCCRDRTVATMPRLAILLSACAVLIEGLTIVAAFVKMPTVRLGLGLAAMSILTGFYLFQGVMWPAWWILLLGFLPWQSFDRSTDVASPSRASNVSPVSSSAPSDWLCSRF